MAATMPAQMAHAGTVPESAYSRSLGISPFLLDDVALGFRLPQLTATYRAQAVALGVSANGSSTTTGLGATAHAGSNAFFFLVQPAEDIAPLIGGSRAFQLGWGREIGRARFGVALRGTRTVNGRSRTSDGHGYVRDDYYNENSHALEGALGFGYGDEDRFIDLVVEARDQQADADSRVVEASPSDTLSMRSRRQLQGDLSPGVALRLGHTLGSGLRLVAAGDWAEDQLDGEIEASRNDTGLEQSHSDYRRRWSVGMTGTGSPARAGDITVFGQYGRADTDVTSSQYTSLNRATESIDSGVLGVAIERNIWRRLDGLAGLRAQYSRTRTSSETWTVSGSGGSVVSSSSYEKESWNDRFGWGLAYRHDRFQVVGSIDSRLNLENLVLSLDARFYF
jgi:hypothetical protein